MPAEAALSTLASQYEIGPGLVSQVLHHVYVPLTFVTLRNRVVWVICTLWATDDMAPPCTDFCASWDGDDGVVLVLDVFVASERTIIYILDWV